MIANPVKRACDIIWQAQDELWKPKPDFPRVRALGLEAMHLVLEHPRPRSNACLVIAKAHEGMGSWFLAVMYWEECRALYPQGWCADMENRLEACRAYRDETAAEEAKVARAVRRH